MSKVTVFVPRVINTECSVYSLYKGAKKSFFVFRFVNLFKKNKDIYLVKSTTPSLQPLISKDSLSKLIFFGHLDEYSKTFLTLNTGEKINYKWVDIVVDIGVLFVTNGAELLLNYQNWSSKFRSWVSFGNCFSPNILLDSFIDMQNEMYQKITYNIGNAKDSLDLYEKINNVYDEYFDKIATESTKKGVNAHELSVAAHILLKNQSSMTYG